MIPRVELAPGYTVSRLIKGGWQLAGGHGVVDPAGALRDMATFVDAGVTTFDCADIYTGVELLIGQFLRTREAGAVQVHTKYVPDLDRLDALTAGDVAGTVTRSRERLGVPVVDLVQFHWWDLDRGDFLAALGTLAALRGEGIIRQLGLTNFGMPALRAVVGAGTGVASLQLQYSLLDRRPRHEVQPFCSANGIRLLCYGALAGGFMHERWLGAVEPAVLENRSLVKYKLIIDECGGWRRFQDLLALLADLDRTYRVGIGALAIRWVLDQPGVAAVIVGARNATHLDATVRAATVTVSEEDRARIATFLETFPSPHGDVYDLERDRDGPHGRIMRYNLGGDRR